jgi:hypothetical protein
MLAWMAACAAMTTSECVGLIPMSQSGDPLQRLSVLSVFASSPLRGEDNDGFAQQCRREVGVTCGQLSGLIPVEPDSRTKFTPTSHGKFDFCGVQKSSRAVLPPQGGEKQKESSDWRDGIRGR